MNLTQHILNHFNEADWKPSMGLRETLPDDMELQPRELTRQLQSLSTAGLLEIRGVKRNAEYRLTPAGRAARDAMRSTEPA